MGALAAGLSLLISKVAALASWFGALFVAVFAALWWLVTDAAVWVFDQVLSVAVSAVGSLDWSAAEGWGAYWSMVPAEMWDVLSVIGLGTAFQIIAAAIAIRFALQIIPFTRLGS